MGRGPTLTTIAIIIMVGLFVTITSFSIYTNLIVENGGQIDGNYSAIYSALSDQYDDAVTQSADIGDPTAAGSVKQIFGRTTDVIFGTLNVFVIGLAAIGKFFSYIPIIQTLFQIMNDVFPQFNALIGLLVTIIILYIATRYIQSARGTSEQV